MKYLLESADLANILTTAENEILGSEKIKFQRQNQWRKSTVPDFPGVYALFEKIKDEYKLIYIGETGNLRDRMNDVCRTVNHTFRRQLGNKRFMVEKQKKKKFADEVEAALNAFFDNHLYVSFLQVNFGRTEIESHLVTKYQNQLFNSETKRKLKIEMDNLSEE